jgi:hypothetical protein
VTLIQISSLVPQKVAPSLTWLLTLFDDVFGDARLRDFKPELEQFTMLTLGDSLP